MDEKMWSEFFKFAGSMGVGGMMMAFGIWFINKDKVQAQAESKADREARIALLEHQNKVCNEDRLLIHKQMGDDRLSFDTKLESLRASFEAKNNSLTEKLFEVYRSRDQRQTAEKMQKAVEAIKTEKIPPLDS